MKYCGCVTDRSWYKAVLDNNQEFICASEGGYISPDRPRIYSDEVELADIDKFIKGKCFINLLCSGTFNHYEGFQFIKG